jgi:hypothetical protein
MCARTRARSDTEVYPLKRFAVLLALLVSLLPAVVHARWVTDEIKWQISSVGRPNDATAVYIRDTTVTSIGPVDTTMGFSLDEATVPPRGVIAPGITGLAGANIVSGLAPNDTTSVGWIIITSDSSAAPTTPALTSITCMIDGRVGAYGLKQNLGSGWVKADSSLANGAVGGGMILGDQTVAFPIRTISPYGNIFRFSELRARITGVGGATGIAAARVFLRYWVPSAVRVQN